MHYDTMFGEGNNIAVATCGKSISLIQELILKRYCKPQEIIIAYDKDFETVGDKDFKKNIDNLKRLGDRFRNYSVVSVLFDKDKEIPKLEHGDAPIDKGKKTFEYLYKNRIVL